MLDLVSASVLLFRGRLSIGYEMSEMQIELTELNLRWSVQKERRVAPLCATGLSGGEKVSSQACRLKREGSNRGGRSKKERMHGCVLGVVLG